MRILQIIDTLETGGAEKMAVSYANALCTRIEFSALVSTRNEGPLKIQLQDSVTYLFLQKRSAFDIMALFRLRSFVTCHRIDTIHAHSTSYFTAALLKMLCPRLKLLWHDHYGENIQRRSSKLLRAFIPLFFDGIIAVNNELMQWSRTVLKFDNVVYLPNFPIDEKSTAQTQLMGADFKRILCIANLRPQKNHLLLLKVAKEIAEKHSDWTFHFVGKDFSDAYSAQVLGAINAFAVRGRVFFYGVVPDISNIIRQCEIAVLSSNSEGLPVALLEYGLHGRAVVMPAVGEIPAIVRDGETGRLFEARDEAGLFSALDDLIEDAGLRADCGAALQAMVNSTYAVSPIINSYLNWLNKIHA